MVIGDSHVEILWGATYRIAMSFLDICFDFKPPASDGRPIFSAHLTDDYFKSA
jgi:hypothetical protein